MSCLFVFKLWDCSLGVSVPNWYEESSYPTKKAVRILTGNQYFQIYGEPPGPLPPSNPLFAQLKLLKFDDIYKLNIAKFVYTTLCEFSPKVFAEWFTYTSDVHAHSTRSSTSISHDDLFDVGTEVKTYTLYIPKSRLANYGDKLIKVYGPLLLNSLPEIIQDACSVQTFKIYLKKYFLESYRI